MQETYYTFLMIVVFIIGYLLITLEHVVKINKTTTALIMAVLCWVLQFQNMMCVHNEPNFSCINKYVSEISQLILFLLGALTIVELISAHKGFKVVANFLQVSSKHKLLWLIGFLTFFLSSILDNLTTTIVIVTLLQKMLKRNNDRLIIGAAAVISANAGGAWTPIGDVTTTMLWIGGQLTTNVMITSLFLPSLVCMIISLLLLTPMLNNEAVETHKNVDTDVEPFGMAIFYLGIGLLIFVPVFKILTNLPPFMGILFALGIIWLVTDLMHSRYHDRDHLRVPNALARVDLSSTLFFLGILLAVSALDGAGILDSLALWIDKTIGNTAIVASLIGLASAVIDNVPLVAATMGMYGLEQYPTDSSFWNMIAYCAGTGGSILIIGSAAGVVYMGLEKVDFFWYLRRISIPALIGYFAGLAVYLLF